MALPLNHLHLHVADVERSVAFYETHLGLRTKQRFGDLVFLGDGRGFDLAIAPRAEGESGDLPGWFHFGCHLEDADAVRAAHDRLAAAGVSIARPFQDHGNYVSFTAEDPDGHGIEIYFDPSLGASAS